MSITATFTPLPRRGASVCAVERPAKRSTAVFSGTGWKVPSAQRVRVPPAQALSEEKTGSPSAQRVRVPCMVAVAPVNCPAFGSKPAALRALTPPVEARAPTMAYPSSGSNSSTDA